ncbi:MAG: PEP-CTERM sorting domain-containing protein [Armatimonadota bacterium]
MREFKIILLIISMLIYSSSYALALGDLDKFDFPPQRCISWNFQYDEMWTNGFANLGPNWGWGVDEVIYDNHITWYETSTLWEGKSGFIGYDNTQGNSDVSLQLRIRINNYPDPNPLKKVKLQMSAVGDVTAQLFGPDESFSVEGFDEFNTYYFEPDLIWIYGEIKPNPHYEDILIIFNVPAGQYAFIDDLNICTACIVPEPGSFLALGTGIAAIAGFVLRRNK